MSSGNVVETSINKLLFDIYHKPKVRINVGDHRRPKFSGKMLSRFNLRNRLKSSNCVRNQFRTYAVLDGTLIVKSSTSRNTLIDKNINYCQTITEHFVTEDREKLRLDSIKPLSYKDFQSVSKSVVSLNSIDNCGFDQWKESMKMAIRLPNEMPPDLRRKFWLKLADHYLKSKHLNWDQIKLVCFNERSNADDIELDSQIIKDLHRTGCDLFCGREGQRNQILLKRVLLAYARWNKKIGYCQGFNMLAAFILQVMNGDEYDSFKVMVYLIEYVLPPYYFGNKLHGLSVDMFVIRSLMDKYLPKLSTHLEKIQKTPSYEPPLVNVFTMQWFLTLFCNCLPQKTVLRVWDLTFLYGNDVILKTALILWENLEGRVMAIKSADEFYSIMGVIMREMFEFSLIPDQDLVEIIVNIDDHIDKEIVELRHAQLFNLNPWSSNKMLSLKDNLTDNPKKRSQEELSFLSDREKVAFDLPNLKNEYIRFIENQKRSNFILNARASITDHFSHQKRSMSIDHLLTSTKALINLTPEGPLLNPSRSKNHTDTIIWTKNMRKRPNLSDPGTTDNESSSSTEFCDSDDS